MQAETHEKRPCQCSDSYLTQKVRQSMSMMRCSLVPVPRNLLLNSAIHCRIALACLCSINFASAPGEDCSPTISCFATSNLPQEHTSRSCHRQPVLRRDLSMPSAFHLPLSVHRALPADGVGERSFEQEQSLHLGLPVWERAWPWRGHSGTWARGELLTLLSFRPYRPR